MKPSVDRVGTLRRRLSGASASVAITNDTFSLLGCTSNTKSIRDGRCVTISHDLVTGRDVLVHRRRSDSPSRF